MKTHFLRAEWNNIILANYSVPKEILQPYVPHKTELAFFEGRSFVSLVGFMFLNTKIYGLSIPMHTNFEEVNLRFYVRYNDHGFWKKGVVFIKEIVPKRAISFIANNVYGENYITLSMRHQHIDKGEIFSAAYEWNYKNKWNKISATTDKKSKPVIINSPEEFFADHYWGYSKSNNLKTYEYEVAHERWDIFKVSSYDIDCDFGALYGNEFAFLDGKKPDSILMTRGSNIKVFPKKTL